MNHHTTPAHTGRSVLIIAIIFAAMSTVALGTNSNSNSTATARPESRSLFIEQELSAAPRFDRSVVDDIPRGATVNAFLGPDTLTSPGIAIGITSYDLQHFGSQGHQIATNPGSNTVHMAWTYSDEISTNFYPPDRFIRYNSWDKALGQWNQGFDGEMISLDSFAMGGYVRIDVNSENHMHATFHQIPDPGHYHNTFHVFLPIEGDALHVPEGMTPVDPAVYPWAATTQFSDICIASNGGTKAEHKTDVYHIIATVFVETPSIPNNSDALAYWRFDTDTTGGVFPQWEGPVIVDSSVRFSYVIDAADNFGKVAVAVTQNYDPAHNGLINVVYRESLTGGLGWLDGSETGDNFSTTITNYNDSVTPGPQAWRQVSIAYDHSGELHIVWTEQRSAKDSNDIAIKHWSSANGLINTAAFGYYPNNHNTIRALNLSYVTLGIGDGATYCSAFETTNEDYLYVLYTKQCGETPEEQNDYSQLGVCNGELYLTVSPDGGNQWTIPANLTNTKTPNCTSTDPDSLCASEQWATITRDVSDIDIFYILDFEAGELFSTGWSINRAMYYNIPGGSTDTPFLCPGTLVVNNCNCHSDPVCDNIYDVFDVLSAVAIAFQDDTSSYPPDCPFSRTDVDCNGITDVFDVLLFVAVTFQNADPLTSFCKPLG